MLALKDALDVLDQHGWRERLVQCKCDSLCLLKAVILSLQQRDGSFQGDKWGETDTRFLYSAVNALAHLKALDRVDKAKTVDWVLRCSNFDGGFGSTEGAESHAAQGACAA